MIKVSHTTPIVVIVFLGHLLAILLDKNKCLVSTMYWLQNDFVKAFKQRI